MRPPLAVVQLAAGRSLRMGARNKLLLQLGGESLVARTARILLRLDAGSVTVVLGHEAERVAAALQGIPVQTVLNRDPSAGQAGSVRVGLAHAPEADAVLLALSDQPRLTLADCAALIAAHRAEAGGRITVPVRRGADGAPERGNPIVIPAALRQRLLREEVSLGCRGLTRRHPELVHMVEIPGEGPFLDLDTPEQLAAERARRAAAIWAEDEIDDRILARVLPPAPVSG